MATSSLANGNPIKNDGRSNHDEAPQQADAATLIRYGLGLPVSAAIVGMSSLHELEANLHAARSLPPLSRAEREALETQMG